MRSQWVNLILVLVLAALLAVLRLAADLQYVADGEPGSLLYAASFDLPAPDLDLFEGRASAQLNAGRLWLQPGEARRLVYAAAGPRVSDFDLEVEAMALAGPLDNGFGVLFRMQEPRPHPLLSLFGLQAAGPATGPGYYLFMISSDGYYQLRRSLNGEQQVLSAWIPSPAIRQGLEVSNRLRIIARGAEMVFYVNGEQHGFCIPDDAGQTSTWTNGRCLAGQMRSVVHDDSLTTGRLALAAQSFAQGGVMAAFDNLLIRVPAETGTGP